MGEEGKGRAANTAVGNETAGALTPPGQLIQPPTTRAGLALARGETERTARNAAGETDKARNWHFAPPLPEPPIVREEPLRALAEPIAQHIVILLVTLEALRGVAEEAAAAGTGLAVVVIVMVSSGGTEALSALLVQHKPKLARNTLEGVALSAVVRTGQTNRGSH